ncbi:hypothetical protein H5W18_01970 [Lactobacillus sp. Marseille-P7033]|nr:hypothetical protein [Lactobacillus sp. Marseille-P7033]
MDKIIALTHQQRIAILRQLTAEQIKALSEFTRYAMLSRFHTRHYLSQTDWKFQGMVIDPWYQRSHDHSGENLYCDCGRRLKNQFILRSRTTGRQLSLGISHFQQHASIPAKVTREIQSGINEINLYMDSILLAYQAGQRFPQAMFQFVLDHQGFKNHEGTVLYQRCNLFSQVDLPLHRRDYEELKGLSARLNNGHPHRLTKEEINQLLAELANDWRQIDQQITMFNYLLRQNMITSQDIHRIKSNSVNYALQRRKTRFFIQNYKQMLKLTLTKARSQLAIKLRQLSFYAQVCQELPAAKFQCEQAKQVMIAHKTPNPVSHFYGIKEAKSLLKK